MNVCSSCSHLVREHSNADNPKSHKTGCQHLIPFFGNQIGENEVYCKCLLSRSEVAPVKMAHEQYEKFVSNQKVIAED